MSELSSRLWNDSKSEQNPIWLQVFIPPEGLSLNPTQPPTQHQTHREAPSSGNYILHFKLMKDLSVIQLRVKVGVILLSIRHSSQTNNPEESLISWYYTPTCVGVCCSCLLTTTSRRRTKMPVRKSNKSDFLSTNTVYQFSTCGAERPRDVEVEVVRGVDGHVEVLVRLHTKIKKKNTYRVLLLSWNKKRKTCRKTSEVELHRMKAYEAFTHNTKQILVYLSTAEVVCSSRCWTSSSEYTRWFCLFFLQVCRPFCTSSTFMKYVRKRLVTPRGQIWIRWPSLCIASILSAMLHPNSTLSCVLTHLKAPREKNKSDNSQEFRRLSLSTADTCAQGKKNTPQLPLNPSLGYPGGQIVYVSIQTQHSLFNLSSHS